MLMKSSFDSDQRDYFVLKYRQDPTRALIGQKPMFYQSIKYRKSVFYCFARRQIDRQITLFIHGKFHSVVYNLKIPIKLYNHYKNINKD